MTYIERIKLAGLRRNSLAMAIRNALAADARRGAK